MTSIETRVRRLERLNTVLVLAVLVVGGGALAAAAGRQEVVRAQRIEVVDDGGRARVVLAVGDDGPAMRIVDDAGVTRASLEDSPEGTALYIMDAHGDTRLGAAQFAHGGGGYALHGPEGRGAAVLYLKGSGSLSFYGVEGDVLARFPEN